ncbi:hypothetical protein BN59_03714 [Legionella massiliensis]|uniref:Uncharacterized protein n=1 Tax=Legionella massiliensis TaxID=1034943 RepID=A0A078L2H7_9GAMM|nr:hypothetical protein [Legionella massiliensis]CDZ79396.1 hypothetical protein BN59_03714 [Legionella massiliensis]CEE15134.1 hypothetical protein BN1094_03714 [Legionella massiliensis]
MYLGRKSINKAVGLLSALLLSGNCLAAQFDKDSLAIQATYLGVSLNELAKANTKEYCSFDVDYSGTILKNTASLIRGNRNEVAQENLAFAARALERVRSNSADCRFFSSMVHPYIEQTRQLISELNWLLHATAH